MSKDIFEYKSIKLKELVKKIKLIENNKSNLENAQNFYYPTFSDSIGLFEILKLFKYKINFFDFYLKILKNIFSGIFFSYSNIYKNRVTLNYDNIIFSWANFLSPMYTSGWYIFDKARYVFLIKSNDASLGTPRTL